MSESVAVNFLGWGNAKVSIGTCVREAGTDDVLTDEQRRKLENQHRLRQAQEEARSRACAIINIAENLLLNGASVSHAYSVAEEFITYSEKIIEDALKEVECTVVA